MTNHRLIAEALQDRSSDDRRRHLVAARALAGYDSAAAVSNDIRDVGLKTIARAEVGTRVALKNLTLILECYSAAGVALELRGKDISMTLRMGDS